MKKHRRTTKDIAEYMKRYGIKIRRNDDDTAWEKYIDWNSSWEELDDRELRKEAKYTHKWFCGLDRKKRLKDDEHRLTRRRLRDKVSLLKGEVVDEEVYDEDFYDVPPTNASDIWKFD